MKTIIFYSLCLMALMGSTTMADTIQPRYIMVTGEATQDATPDRFTFSVTVESTHKQLDDLAPLHAKRLNKVSTALSKVVSKKALHTTQQAIRSQYDHRQQPKKFLHYVAVTSIQIEAKSLADYETLMTLLTQLEVHHIGNVTYTVSNHDAIYQLVQQNAYKHALQKATQLAKTAKQRIGAPLSIEELPQNR